jgi:HEAT repeat protein
MIAFIGIVLVQAGAMIVAADEIKSVHSPILEDTVAQLGRLKPGTESDRAVTELARQGDLAVAEIAEQLRERNPDFGWAHQAVLVLKRVNSARARTLLRRMAMGELSPGNENWAAQALIACDQSEAWTLLASVSPQVLTTVLNALDGQQVTEERLPAIKKLLDSKDPLLSWRAAEVMAAGTSAKLADEAVEAIGRAMTTVTDLPGADAPAPHRYRFGTVFTLGEQYYSRYLGALACSHVDKQSLRDLANRLQGRARDAVVLALARRGDKSVREAVVKLAQDPQAGLFRAWAVDALSEIGTPDDLPLLRTLAESDPLVREGPLSPPNPVDSLGPTYPVRQAAKDAIRTIENRNHEDK